MEQDGEDSERQTAAPGGGVCLLEAPLRGVRSRKREEKSCSLEGTGREEKKKMQRDWSYRKERANCNLFSLSSCRV